jgi:tRNA A-37 threonylcarbamoyl transferase component Bud32
VIIAVIDGHTYHIDDDDRKVFLSSGGEADVYRFTPNEAFCRVHGRKPYLLKVFQEETEAQRQAAIERQTTLRLPRGRYPSRVIVPVAIAKDRSDKIIGYVMEFVPNATQLIEFKTVDFRDKNGITIHQILRVLRNLHSLITEVHQMGGVIGDLNDKNFLVTSSYDLFMIDFDGSWGNQAYVLDFVDPLICKPGDPARPKSLLDLRKIGKHSQETDWYAFAVIAFNLLALIHPFLGGIHRPPKSEGPRRSKAQRIHARITVFNPHVSLPKMETAIPYGAWPIELLRCFQLIFEKNVRGVFPPQLLSDQFWTTCVACRTVHGRTKCPTCGAAGVNRPATVPVTTAVPSTPSTVRTTVPPPLPATSPAAPSTRGAFRTNGTIITAAFQAGGTRYVYHEGGAYRREDGTPILNQPQDPRLTVLVAGERTVFCAGTQFAVSNGNPRTAEKHTTHRQYGRTTVAANSRHVYWVNEGSLVRDNGRRGQVRIGTVAPHMTSVWAGERFGVAMVQAGVITQVHTFDAGATRFTGTYTLPYRPGKVVDAHCVINNDYAWLTVTVRAPNGLVTHTCYVFDAQARPRAIVSGRPGDGTWLESINRSALPHGDKLLVPVTGTGIVQVGFGNDARIRTEGVYGHTASLVPQHSNIVALCAAPHGILLATQQTIVPLALGQRTRS